MDEDRKPRRQPKVLIEFQGDYFDSKTINAIQQKTEYSSEFALGTAYVVVLKTSIFPWEYEYKFETEKLREIALIVLQEKLEEFNVIFK